MKRYSFPINNFLVNPSPHILVFGSLLLSSLFYHVILFAIITLTKGSILSYSTRIVKQIDLFNFSLDGGYLEHFQYILLFWCFLLSLLVCAKARARSPIISIPIIYFFLFIDDSLSLHDIGYNTIIPHLTTPFTVNQGFIRVKDFAEISYWICILFIAFLISIKDYSQASSAGRNFLKGNYSLFLLMAIFGKFFDVVNSNISKWMLAAGLEQNSIFYYLKFAFNLVEEIGEFGVICFAVLWLFHLACESLSPSSEAWVRLFTQKR